MNNIQFDEELFRKLTDREIEIIKCAGVDGLSCKMTADRLGTTTKTIQVHRHNILSKLQCGNIARAVYWLTKGNII